MKQNKKKILFGFLILLIVCSCDKKPNHTTIEEREEAVSKYGVFIGANYEQLDVSQYDIIVIDAVYYSKEEIERLQQKGMVVYTYLNVGSLEDFRDFYFDYQQLILGEYENWLGEYWIDVSNVAWQNHIVELAASLVDKGVDGFFIDNTDVYYHYHTPDIFQGLITILNQLSEYEKDILINGGDIFVAEAILAVEEPLVKITGVNQECVFTKIDFEKGELMQQSAEDTNYYQEYLKRCRSKDLKVYLLEYTTDETLVQSIEEYCHTYECQYYIASSIDLQ